MKLIDANELKKKMCFKCNDEYSDEPCDPGDCVFCNAINDAQTIDAVPVVRCKDCLWYENLTLICHLHSQFYDGGRYWDMFRPDDFCSYGERKEGADNEP